MRKYWSGAHTKNRLRYHVVWIPKRRKSILLPHIAKRLKEILYNGCALNKWWIESLGIQADYVHVLIQIKPRESISSVVHRMKGATSRLIRKEYPELEEFVWGDSLWNDGYFAETIGTVDEEQIKKYIEAQRMPR